MRLTIIHSYQYNGLQPYNFESAVSIFHQFFHLPPGYPVLKSGILYTYVYEVFIKFCLPRCNFRYLEDRNSMSHFQLFEDLQDNEHDESWPAQDLTSGPERGHSFPLGLPVSDPGLRLWESEGQTEDKWRLQPCQGYTQMDCPCYFCLLS